MEEVNKREGILFFLSKRLGTCGKIKRKYSYFFLLKSDVFTATCHRRGLFFFKLPVWGRLLRGGKKKKRKKNAYGHLTRRFLSRSVKNPINCQQLSILFLICTFFLAFLLLLLACLFPFLTWLREFEAVKNIIWKLDGKLIPSCGTKIRLVPRFRSCVNFSFKQTYKIIRDLL